MPMSDLEKVRLIKEANDEIVPYSTTLLGVKGLTNDPAKQPEELKTTSCVLVVHDGQPMAVAAEHVVKSSWAYFTGAARLSKPDARLALTSQHTVTSLDVIAKDATHDLALFDVRGQDLVAAKLRCYD